MHKLNRRSGIQHIKEQILQVSGSGVPLTHQTLVSSLNEYKRPNDKISDLLNDGFIESVKRCIYVPGRTMQALQPERSLLANHLFGPSYVSLDFALSHYGLIPERVYEVSSMTTKSTRKFETLAGVFTYTHLALPYYAFGQVTKQLSGKLHALFATREKALCDKVVTTKGILLRSKADARTYAFDDLRMDESGVKNLTPQNASVGRECSPKKRFADVN